MSGRPLFESDAYLRSARARVVASGRDDVGPWIALDETPFYPEGGGQPADAGTIGGVRVVDVRRAGGAIRHYLDGAFPEGEVDATIDWARRYDHMQQHTAQHAITALAADRFGWRTSAFHLGARLSDVELDVPSLDRTQLDALEDAVLEIVAQARPVRARRVGPDELAGLAVRTRGLPDDHEGEVRLVEIAGLDLNTCGGTHVASTAELAPVKLLHTEPMRGGTRVYFVAGGRARRRFAEHERRAAALRSLVGCGEDELLEVVGLKLEQLRDALRRAERADDALADAVADRLAAAGDEVVAERFPFGDARFLQRVARRVAASPTSTLALLAAGAEPEGPFVLCAGTRCRGRVEELGPLAAKLLEGRGGGRGPIFQGKARALGLLGAARAALRDALG